MNGKQLKNSILQWAIQGKLVPQDPNDEPASVLLGRIRAEKARLVKEGKIKKDKNESIIFKGDDNSYYEKFADGKVVCIDDEIPFEIPAGWEWCRLGSILSIVSDGTHKTPNYVEHGIPFLSVQNISSGELDLSKIKYITPEEHQQLISRVHPMQGDILVCRIGTLGKAIKITWDFEFSIFVSLGLLRPVLAELADYIVSYINSPWGNRWIQENKVGGGTHTYKINLGDFPNMMICIPPYQEQVRIKERINLFEPSLKSYTKAQQQLDELNATINDTLKKSILQEAIKGKLVPQNPEDEPAEKLLKRIDAEKQRLVKEGKLKAKDAITSVIFKGEDNKYYEKIGGQTTEITAEIPYDIPATWCWCRLQNIVNIKDADRRPVSKEERIAGIYPYYGANGILDYVNKYIFDGTYILVGEDGSVMNKNGNPIVNRAVGKIWVNNHAHILEEYGKLGYFDFLYYALQCADISGYVHGFMPKYSQGDLRKTLIAIPPIKEQIRIVQTILKTTPLL